MHKYLSIALSYIWDIPIEKVSSPQNDYLELVWSQGKKVLNTRNANYSFGSDTEVFQEAFISISKDLLNIKSVLILGFGCGGILKILEKKYFFNGKATGIEFDKTIIDIFNKYFRNSHSSELKVVNQDAQEYVSNSSEKFDLILIDLFIDLDVAPFVYHHEFMSKVLSILNNQGNLVINLIPKRNELVDELLISLSSKLSTIKKLEVNELNTVLLGSK